MTLAEMKTAVYRRLRESSSAPVYFTDAQITQAINDGYAELSDETNWDERRTTMDLLNDRPYYDARTTLGDSFLAVGAAFNETTTRWLVPLAVSRLDLQDRRWETVTGEPTALVTHGLWWLGYWPRVQVDSGTVQQYWTALPDDLEDDEDEPGFPEPFHVGCVDFAVADLQAQDGQARQTLTAWAAYVERETALQAWVQNRASGPLRQGYAAYTR